MNMLYRIFEGIVCSFIGALVGSALVGFFFILIAGVLKVATIMFDCSLALNIETILPRALSIGLSIGLCIGICAGFITGFFMKD